MGRNASARDGDAKIGTSIDINIGAYGKVHSDGDALYGAGEHGERPR